MIVRLVWFVIPGCLAQLLLNGQLLPELLDDLRAEGCNVLEKTDDSEYGKFGWVIDPEGNKVNLCQPPPNQ